MELLYHTSDWEKSLGCGCNVSMITLPKLITFTRKLGTVEKQSDYQLGTGPLSGADNAPPAGQGSPILKSGYTKEAGRRHPIVDVWANANRETPLYAHRSDSSDGDLPGISPWATIPV